MGRLQVSTHTGLGLCATWGCPVGGLWKAAILPHDWLSSRLGYIAHGQLHSCMVYACIL